MKRDSRARLIAAKLAEDNLRRWKSTFRSDEFAQ